MKLEQFQSAVTEVREEYIEDLFDYIDDRQKSLKTKRRLRFLLIAAAMTVLLALPCSLFFALRKSDPPPEEEPAATVYIGLYPSMEIGIDEDRNVLTFSASEDEKSLFANVDFVGKPVQNAVGDIVLSSIESGHLNDTDNTVFLTVKSKNEVFAVELCSSLEASVNAVMKENLPGGQVEAEVFDDQIRSYIESQLGVGDHLGITFRRSELVDAYIIDAYQNGKRYNLLLEIRRDGDSILYTPLYEETVDPDDGFSARFCTEIAKNTKLARSAGSVEVLDCVRSKGMNAYIVTLCIDGKTVAYKIDHGCISLMNSGEE